MSGGVAFVYDSNGTFPNRVNPDMVDVERPDPGDLEMVKNDIATHVALTNSSRAKRLLADWENQQVKFVKVIPRQYKRVLAALDNARRSGVDPDIAVMATAQG
jgi:glutamate synthase (NADPH/NADH) large chain